MNIERLRTLLCGLAAGDCIGSLTEFLPRADVPRVYAQRKREGWPFAPVRGPMWDKGEPTDDTDMAMCIVRPYLKHGRFDPDAVAREFLAWFNTLPKDIGGTTARSLSHMHSGMAWHESGYPQFRSEPANAANGSLMRNGVVPAMATSLDEAFLFTALHGMMTHYDPLSMLCCAAQTWLIWRLLEGDSPLDGNWQASFMSNWTSWLTATGDEAVRAWLGRTQERMPVAWKTFEAAPFDPDRFNPFKTDFTGRAGYCLLTLQVAVWALHWSSSERPFPTPPGFPAEVFERRGTWCIGWPALIGHDADTYGAATGPLIAAAHGDPPESMTAPLRALLEFDNLRAGGAAKK